MGFERASRASQPAQSESSAYSGLCLCPSSSRSLRNISENKKGDACAATRPGSNLRLGGQGHFASWVLCVLSCLSVSSRRRLRTTHACMQQMGGTVDKREDADCSSIIHGRLAGATPASQPVQPTNTPWSIPICGSAGKMGCSSRLAPTGGRHHVRAPPPLPPSPRHISTLRLCGLVRRNGRVALHILGADLAWSEGGGGQQGGMGGWMAACCISGQAHM